MKRIYQSASKIMILAFALSGISVTSCNFDSDKDYRTEEKDGAVDSAQRGSREYQQHHESNPPVDAVKGDTSQSQSEQGNPSGSMPSNSPVTTPGARDGATPPRSNDSSIKKDSSKNSKKTSSLTPRKGRVQLSEWTFNNGSKKEMDKDGIYSNTDVLPEYPGGKQAIQKYIEENINYPQAAVDDDVEGTVQVSFAIDENGNVYKATAAGKGIGYGLEQEALRVVKKMPKWKPGMVNGKKVKTRLSLPVVFLIS